MCVYIYIYYSICVDYLLKTCQKDDIDCEFLHWPEKYCWLSRSDKNHAWKQLSFCQSKEVEMQYSNPSHEQVTLKNNNR